ncbi:hypothetical protein [Aliarcobacter skirrowii]|uniref:hypothetical protein n=1 Tax=Aliarcobacter skirrowii TaxID=28200 RepID=UPI002A35EE58|nr:hypothetical protein [Aliarcobacter skirrowii]MDY0181414.1 hypothetical protein [Aliarcobacter skirrowii]
MSYSFNSTFWEIWGVNNRVYEPFDIFSVKSHNLDENEIKKYKNLNRDKQADIESYDNFLKNDNLLSNEKFLEHLIREQQLFYIFFIDYLLGDSEQVRFYTNQLNNIAINFRVFERQKLEQEKFIKLFAFQIAYIIENMNYNSLNIANFENSLKENSIMPFFDKYREIRDCNNRIKKMTQKDLAIQLSYINSKIKEKFEENKIYVEEVTAETFNKNISKWKNIKELPSFIKILVIADAIKKDDKQENISMLFQLLIIRALLHIKKDFKVDVALKDKFINQLRSFRDEIKALFLSDKKDEITNLQNKYLIDYPNRLEQPERDLKSILEEIDLKQKEFFKHNDGDKEIKLEFPNRDFIINTFNKCKTTEEYINLLNQIKDVSDDNPYSDCINNSINFIRFVISIKIEDKRLFNEKYKYLDRGLGTLLSNGVIEKNLQAYIEVLKGRTDLIECINLIAEHFKKLSTIG